MEKDYKDVDFYIFGKKIEGIKSINYDAMKHGDSLVREYLEDPYLVQLKDALFEIYKFAIPNYSHIINSTGDDEIKVLYDEKTQSKIDKIKQHIKEYTQAKYPTINI